MIRVLIADDQEMVRAGFRMILETQDDIEVVADVADGIAAVRRVRHGPAPDAVLEVASAPSGPLRVTAHGQDDG